MKITLKYSCFENEVISNLIIVWGLYWCLNQWLQFLKENDYSNSKSDYLSMYLFIAINTIM